MCEAWDLELICLLPMAKYTEKFDVKENITSSPRWIAKIAGGLKIVQPVVED